MRSTDTVVAIVVLALVGLFVYFLPALIAQSRGNKAFTAIFVLNLFAAWTGVAWIVALVWAFAGEKRGPDVAMRSCPRCAEEIRAEAAACRFCGFALEQRRSAPSPQQPAMGSSRASGIPPARDYADDLFSKVEPK